MGHTHTESKWCSHTKNDGCQDLTVHHLYCTLMESTVHTYTATWIINNQALIEKEWNQHCIPIHLATHSPKCTMKMVWGVAVMLTLTACLALGCDARWAAWWRILYPNNSNSSWYNYQPRWREKILCLQCISLMKLHNHSNSSDVHRECHYTLPWAHAVLWSVLGCMHTCFEGKDMPGFYVGTGFILGGGRW